MISENHRLTPLPLPLSERGILSKADVPSLPTANLKPGTPIMLSGCHTGEGTDSIAQAFASHFGQRVLGVNGGLSFGLPGLNQFSSSTNSIPRKSGTILGIPYIFVPPVR